MIINPMQRAGKQPVGLSSCSKCGARTRLGMACRSPAVKGKARCRMHGGAFGSGAPDGRRNGNYRHGGATREAIAYLGFLRAWLKLVKRDIQ